MPEFLLRFLCWLLVHSLYRLDERGLDNIPEEGAALLVCNHVSFVDALVISAACRRPIRFVMESAIFSAPVINVLARGMKAVPIAPVPVVPIALSGLWGSIFSRRAGRFWGPLVRSLSRRIGIAVGSAVRPEQVTPELLRERVLALCARA